MYAVCMRAISLQFSGFAGRYANLSQCFGLLNEAWYRAGGRAHFLRPRARHCPAGPKLPARSARDGDRLKAGDDRAARVRALYPVRAWLRDGSEIVIRPIGPEDAASEQAFTQALSAESRYFRFMSTLRELPADMLHRFTHPDFDREVALIALAGAPTQRRQIGVARCIAKDAQLDAEFAVVVADDPVERHFGGDRALFDSFRAGCVERFAVDIAAGDAAVAAEDAAALRRVAHGLKAVLELIGHPHLAATARALEDAPAGEAGAAAWARLAQGLVGLGAQRGA